MVYKHDQIFKKDKNKLLMMGIALVYALTLAMSMVIGASAVPGPSGPPGVGDPPDPCFESGRLTIPTVVAPVDNAVVNGDSGLLSDWSDVLNANQYSYESYHNEALTDQRWAQPTTVSEKTATSSVGEATFWWRVKAVDTTGTYPDSCWSDGWKVTIDNTAPVVNGITLNTKSVSSPRDTNCGPTDFNLVSGKINLGAEINDAISGVNSASYKIVKVTDGGCIMSNPLHDYGSGVYGFRSSTVNMTSSNGDDWITPQGSMIDTKALGLNGTYTIMLTSTDDAGNKSVRYIDIAVDNINPVISNANISKEVVRSSDTPTLSADVDGTGSTVASAQYRIHTANGDKVAGFGWVDMQAVDSTFDNVNESITKDMDLTGLVDSEYVARVRAFDAAGNKKSGVDVSFTIDNTAPTTPIGLGFLSPTLLCGAVTNIHYTTVNWDDSFDANGVKGYWYSIDHPGTTGIPAGIWTTFKTSSQHSGGLFEGAHFIKVQAVDNAGNVSDWTSLCDITADWTAPVVDITAPSDDGTVNGVVAVMGSVEDTNPHHYWTIVKDSLGNKVAGPGTVNQSDSFIDEELFTWDTTLVNDGEYTIILAARDAAENRDDSAGSVMRVIVTVDNRPDNKDECKNGGWELGLDLNTPFRNQGDCVSYFMSDKQHEDNPDGNPWEMMITAFEKIKKGKN